MTRVLLTLFIKKKFNENGKKNVPQSSSGYDKSLTKNCKFCSYTHKCGNCSAYGKKCKNCLKPNHFAKCCPNKSANIQKKSVKHVDCDSSDSDQYYAADDTFFVGSVDIDTATSICTETQTASSDGQIMNLLFLLLVLSLKLNQN